MRASSVIGIDFGASFSTAAVLVNGKLHYALDGRGDACIPTAVYFPPRGAPVVGAEAASERIRHPDDVAYGFKRLLGSTYDSPERQLADTVSAMRLKKGPKGEILVRTAQGDHTPVEIASLVIRELKSLLEKRLCTKIKRAVVTAPARASALARKQTIDAARLAGLEVVDLLPEPVAAALSFGLDSSERDRRFLVYDFGGGTFDSSVVAQRGDELTVFASDGDECLGGDNFDAELARWLAGEMWRTAGRDPTKDRVLWDRIVRLSELAKRALSSSVETTVRIDEEGRDRVAIPLSRSNAESIWKDLIERSIATSARTVMSAGARPADLAGIMMVGGTTFIPSIQARVKQVFQVPCGWNSSAQTAVAAGAALLGGGRRAVTAGWES